MASKRKRSSNQVVENEVLKIRSTYDEGIDLSEDYSIIWKIPQDSGYREGSFFLGYRSYLNTYLKLKCNLRFVWDLKDSYSIVSEVHGNSLMKFPYNFPESMHISLSLLDTNNRVRNTHKKVIKTLDKEGTVIELKKFIKKADLFDENNSFLSNGQLIIYCKIYHGEERHIKTEKIFLDDDSPTSCERKVLDNFEGLLKSGEFSDMKFIIGSKELKVHKYILSAQSPVFEAMFKHDTQEQRNNSVEIIDISYNAMKEVLRFLYAGKVNNIETFAKDIFVAADKYEINALKAMCEVELIGSLSIENISDMLTLLDRYDSKYLKKGVLNFISDNAKNLNSIKNFNETLKSLSNNLSTEIVQLLMSRD